MSDVQRNYWGYDMLIFWPSEFKYFFCYLSLRWDLKLDVQHDAWDRKVIWVLGVLFLTFMNICHHNTVLWWDHWLAQECKWWEPGVAPTENLGRARDLWKAWELLCVTYTLHYGLLPGFYFWSLMWPQGSYDMSSGNCTWIPWEIKLWHPSPGFSLLEPDALCSVGLAQLFCDTLLFLDGAAWPLLRYWHGLLEITT